MKGFILFVDDWFTGKWEDNTTIFIHLRDFIGFHKRTLHSIKAGTVTSILTVGYTSRSLFNSGVSKHLADSLLSVQSSAARPKE